MIPLPHPPTGVRLTGCGTMKAFQDKCGQLPPPHPHRTIRGWMVGFFENSDAWPHGPSCPAMALRFVSYLCELSPKVSGGVSSLQGIDSISSQERSPRRPLGTDDPLPGDWRATVRRRHHEGHPRQWCRNVHRRPVQQHDCGHSQALPFASAFLHSLTFFPIT